MLMRSSKLSDSSGEYLRQRGTIVRKIHDNRIERMRENSEEVEFVVIPNPRRVRKVIPKTIFKLLRNKTIAKLLMDILLVTELSNCSKKDKNNPDFIVNFSTNKNTRDEKN